MSSDDSWVKPRPWFAAQAGASTARSRSFGAPAVKYPLRRPAVSGDSAARFLLTDLEPALQLARQIRRTMIAPNGPVRPSLARDRRDEAVKLLSNRPEDSAA